MKATLNLLLLTALSLLAAHARPPLADRVAVKYGQRGGMVRFCLDGEDCGRMMEMKLFRLYEVDEAGKSVGNAAANFNAAEYTWLEPEYALGDANNTVSARQKIEARVGVGAGKPSDRPKANFSMTTELFYADTVIEYGNATLNATAGALKFSVEIADWPWKDDDTSNGLKFGVKLQVKTKEGNDASDSPSRLELDGGGNTTIKRYEWGDGMRLDSPEFCILDYVNGGNVTTSIEPASDDDGIAIEWRFPHFEKHLYYDPIMGDDSVDFQAASDADSSASDGGSENGGGRGSGAGDGTDENSDGDSDGAVRPAILLSCLIAVLVTSLLG